MVSTPNAASTGGVARRDVVDAPIAGKLRLGIRVRNGRSYAADQYHENALRVLKPLYLDDSGQVVYTMVNPGGAYLGADVYEIDVDIGANASLLLTTQSATKVYKTPQGPARQRQRIRLAPGSVLESVPDQVIVYREGRYLQETVVDMDPTATLLMGEIVTPGWSPTGVSFAYEELRMRTEIRAELDGRTRRLAVDNLRIKPGEGPDVAGIGFMEGYSHTGQLLLADRRVQDLIPELADLVEASATRSSISKAGADRPDGLACCAIRSLADRTGDIRDLHLGIANLVRDRWRGQRAIDLRKYS
ncbi:urease accessory protein UreD [Kocuria massiliensis]|uniref:urease accessory protein UreD n=1 Tax=Kocuria massiliensis TaxID=1926282 RepID=UPI0022B940F0|nr:urease accessory protein UreD [Kocuria massiliensis]